MKTIKEQFKGLFPNDMRKYNRWGSRHGIKLTERISVLVSPQIRKGIDLIIESGKFPNPSEFIRHLIVNYFDEVCNNLD